MVDLQLELHQKQSWALQAPATEVVYGGAAGGGKSHLIRVASIIWAMTVPGLQIYLFRRSFPELKQNHLEGAGSYPILLAPLIAAKLCRIVDMEIRFWNGSKIKLRHLQSAASLGLYQGAEIHVLLVDELTHFTDEEYRYLRGRMRLGGLKIPDGCPWEFPRSLCGTNPGGVGHHWVKKGFVDLGAFRVQRMSKKEGGMLRTFIPAKLEDNATQDPAYADKLEGLGDPLLVRALLDGDWSIIAGAMFGGVWRPDRHVCEPFAIPVDWKIWAGMDDGYTAPASCHWMTQSPYTGTYYVIDELYETGMLADRYVEKVLDRQYRIKREENGRTVLNDEEFRGFMDNGCWKEEGSAEISRGKQMAAKLRMKPVEKWNGSRVDAVQNFHRLLAPNPRDPKGRPGIIFFSNCTEAIRTIPALPRDPRDQEDILTTGEDHAWDSVRYGLQKPNQVITRKKV